MTCTYSDLFLAAAAIIKDCGYSRWADSVNVENRAPEHSIHTALYAAALVVYTNDGDAADATEEAESRFAGYLYMTGQHHRRTTITDIADQVATWEAHTPGRQSTTEQICTELQWAAKALAATGTVQDMAGSSRP